MSFPVGTPPTAFLYIVMETMDAFPTSAPVQVSMYIGPATGLPDAVMFTAWDDTDGKDQQDRYYEGPGTHLALMTLLGGIWLNARTVPPFEMPLARSCSSTWTILLCFGFI